VGHYYSFLCVQEVDLVPGAGSNQQIWVIGHCQTNFQPVANCISDDLARVM